MDAQFKEGGGLLLFFIFLRKEISSTTHDYLINESHSLVTSIQSSFACISILIFNVYISIARRFFPGSNFRTHSLLFLKFFSYFSFIGWFRNIINHILRPYQVLSIIQFKQFLYEMFTQMVWLKHKTGEVHDFVKVSLRKTLLAEEAYLFYLFICLFNIGQTKLRLESYMCDVSN